MKRLALILLLLPATLNAQTTAHMTANISKAIAISEGNYMNFGNVSFTGAGKVTLTSSETRILEGSVTSSDANFTPNTIIAKGTPNAAFAVTLPASATVTDGQTTLTISGFKSNLTNNVGTLDATGLSVLRIGATLEITVSATSGVYAGTYIINCVYQ